MLKPPGLRARCNGKREQKGELHYKSVGQQQPRYHPYTDNDFSYSNDERGERAAEVQTDSVDKKESGREMVVAD